MIPVFQISQCRKSQLDCYRGYRSEHAIGNCLIALSEIDALSLSGIDPSDIIPTVFVAVGFPMNLGGTVIA
jgi:hypothetical protein